MRHLNLAALCVIILLSSSQCDTEVDPPPQFGHVKLTVTYPEPVIINGSLEGFAPAPGVGAEVWLYDGDAICRGYRDVRAGGHAWIGLELAPVLYTQQSNEQGEILFTNIPEGKYFLLIYARQLYKYTEKYFEVNGGDTLKLVKDFTPSATFYEDLEPWDYEMDGYPYY